MTYQESDRRPRLLDLFCGAGGAAVGYHRAGFEVVGVDIKPQPNYPFDKWHEDALYLLRDALRGRVVAGGYTLGSFDAIHASPPCQAYTATNGNMTNARQDHPRLIEPLRDLLEETRLPYVIENVPGAPLRNPVQLCGTSFGLGVDYRGSSGPHGRMNLRRHRLFEMNWPLLVDTCRVHRGLTIGIHGDHASWNRRRYGPGKGQFSRTEKVALAQEAMGIDWTDSWEEIKEAIPPAYTELIGHQLLAHIQRFSTRGTP